MRSSCIGFLAALLALGAAQGALAGITSAPIANPPQFILFSHDDAMNSAAKGYVLDVTDSVTNPDGCKAVATWFACTTCDFDCGTARSLFQYGHEVATHTIHHDDLRDMSASQVKSEIVGARDKIAGCGIPKDKVVGFRTPYLSDSPTVRSVLAKNGFRYDSTIGAEGGSNKPWPASLGGGMPYDCDVGGNLCSSSERYPGFWEVPLYETGPYHNLMDYCTNENNGNPISGCSPFKGLKQQFDAAYRGNRAPVTIGCHSITTGFLQNNKFRGEIKQFLSYARSQGSDVWIVTISQFLDWMQNPVPANKMPAFMARYKTPGRCAK